MTTEPILRVTYRVIAYDAGGYGDDRSRDDFTSGEAAIEYAKSLPNSFRPTVYKTVTMEPIRTKIFPT